MAPRRPALSLEKHDRDPGRGFFLGQHLAILLNIIAMTKQGASKKTGRGRGHRELEEWEQTFRALSHASRRHALVVLQARGGRMTAGDIAGRFSCAWPTMSRHLRVLEDAGLVTVEKDGRERIYVLERARLTRIVGRWLGFFAPSDKDTDNNRKHED